mmetsp:Transcript_1419/g.3860  ORF Transcript_1419/g.3860 Transcript_1419/m.3860 type:complete len:213 (+) Transcript_1419:423-1061(+)
MCSKRHMPRKSPLHYRVSHRGAGGYLCNASAAWPTRPQPFSGPRANGPSGTPAARRPPTGSARSRAWHLGNAHPSIAPANGRRPRPRRCRGPSSKCRAHVAPPPQPVGPPAQPPPAACAPPGCCTVPPASQPPNVPSHHVAGSCPHFRHLGRRTTNNGCVLREAKVAGRGPAPAAAGSGRAPPPRAHASADAAHTAHPSLHPAMHCTGGRRG